MVGGERDVGLFLAVWALEGVDALDLDAVQVLAGLLYHRFVGTSVHDEHEGVVVFNSLDG